ncbi:WD40 repeat-like protein [Violaceomyces palustris]|uniref:WD40 repeat-like protein n=1 Tax=Violaceomyces palustris TaxID=1673888 RepID=A0ACD0NRW7_9BASI|nr:WD40 repeat-like protein [Violaceomyces palustris]
MDDDIEMEDEQDQEEQEDQYYSDQDQDQDMDNENEGDADGDNENDADGDADGDEDDDDDDDEDEDDGDDNDLTASHRSISMSRSGSVRPNPSSPSTYMKKVEARRRIFVPKADCVETTRGYQIEPMAAAPHSCQIHAMALNQDGSCLLSGGSDGFVRRYDLYATMNGKSMLTQNVRHGFVEGITRGGVLSSWWANEEVPPVKNEDEEDDRKERPVGPVHSLACQADALWGLSGSESGSINLWGIRHEPGVVRHVLRKHTAAVSALALTSNDTELISGGWDRGVHQWDLHTGQITRSYPGHAGQVSSISFRPIVSGESSRQNSPSISIRPTATARPPSRPRSSSPSIVGEKSRSVTASPSKKRQSEAPPADEIQDTAMEDGTEMKAPSPAETKVKESSEVEGESGKDEEERFKTPDAKIATPPDDGASKAPSPPLVEQDKLDGGAENKDIIVLEAGKKPEEDEGDEEKIEKTTQKEKDTEDKKEEEKKEEGKEEKGKGEEGKEEEEKKEEGKEEKGKKEEGKEEEAKEEEAKKDDGGKKKEETKEGKEESSRVASPSEIKKDEGVATADNEADGPTEEELAFEAELNASLGLAPAEADKHNPNETEDGDDDLFGDDPTEAPSKNSSPKATDPTESVSEKKEQAKETNSDGDGDGEGDSLFGDASADGDGDVADAEVDANADGDGDADGEIDLDAGMDDDDDDDDDVPLAGRSAMFKPFGGASNANLALPGRSTETPEATNRGFANAGSAPVSLPPPRAGLPGPVLPSGGTPAPSSQGANGTPAPNGTSSKTEKPIKALPKPAFGGFSASSGFDSDVSKFSQDIMMTSTLAGQVMLWDRRVKADGKGVRALALPDKTPPWCASACWNATGDRIYVGRRNESVDEWDLRMLPDNFDLRGGGYDGRTYPKANPRFVRSLRLPSGSGPVTSVAPMPNGRHIICGSFDNVRLWNTAYTPESSSRVPFRIVAGHHGGAISQILTDSTCQFLLTASGDRGWMSTSTEALLVHEIKPIL